MLNPRQQRFCQEYIVDLNGTQAAIRAGYKEKNAAVVASQNLNKLNIQDKIQELQIERSKRTEITADDVIKELAKLGFSNMMDYITTQPDGSCFTDLSKLTRDQSAAISEITTDEYVEGRGEDSRLIKKIKLKLHDKVSALEKIGRHLGMFTDKLSVDMTINSWDALEKAIKDQK